MPYLLQRLIALVALIALVPVAGIVALVVILDDGRPALYRGTRLGLGARPFEQLKFRSMINGADALLDQVHADAPTNRVTRSGAILRRLSLDELPQLVNVITGDMALVGPRPLLPDLLERVGPDHDRFDVRPGLTGLAQIAGRNDVLWSERLRLDEQYAGTRNTKLDIKILVKTVSVVLGQRGIASDRNPSQVLDI